ncbi:MAG: DNA double-strand break repair nuclease NurA [Euryarchaeota archaeon]
MFDVTDIVEAMCGRTPKDRTFEPTDVQLSDSTVSIGKAAEDAAGSVSFRDGANPPINSIHPDFPLDRRVVAIDSTSVVLGYVPEGLVGAIRASVILKPEGKTQHALERYGPYLVVVTNYDKDELYANACERVYGEPTPSKAPDVRKTLDRLRNLLERYLQFQAVKTYTDALLLIDGSLMAGAVADPMFVVKNLVRDAEKNDNAVVALSKSTTLTLKENHLSILSLVDGVPGACYIGDLREHLTQDQKRYVGNVYVGRLTPGGEAFRFDIPENASITHGSLFSMLAGLSGEHGYPEELKLAHMTCVLSSISMIELQAAAINLHGLEMKENFRRKLFPL